MIDTRYRNALPPTFQSTENEANIICGYNYGSGYDYGYNYGNGYGNGYNYGSGYGDNYGYTYNFDYGNGYAATVTENLTFEYCVDKTCNENRYSYALNNPLIYSDPSGEVWWHYVIVGAFFYSMAAKNNTPEGKNDGNPGNWEWRFWKWSYFQISGGTDGDKPYVSVSGGTPDGPNPAIGYSPNRGWGVGYSQHGQTNMYYPGYENRVNNSIEQNTNTAVYQARTDNYQQNSYNNSFGGSGSGLGTDFYTGIGLTTVSETLFSRDLGTWMGKNMKFYDQSWGGNKYTGGKFKFAESWAKPFRFGSQALGTYGIVTSINDGFRGNISPAEATGDVIFGGAAMYSGFWGGWANLWYNLGKEYGPISNYLRKREERMNRFSY